MASRHIPERIRCMLWGRAAGRCEFAGCNKIVHRHHETQEAVNLADVAHVIGFSEDGPRGEAELSEEQAKDIENLMLVCKACHKTFDDYEGTYLVERLQKMKQQHERRIELLTSIAPQYRSHMVLYCANIGEHEAKVSYQAAANAMVPNRYPADPHPVSIGLVNSAVRDKDEEFWRIEQRQLETKFALEVLPRLRDDTADHLSVFALAPQPLLMRLGHLLCDIPNADVYQLHREPPTWDWQVDESKLDVCVSGPKRTDGTPALVIALSATINDERVQRVLPEASIWRITVPNPNNDLVRSRDHLKTLRKCFRDSLNEIKATHGEGVTLHVFPAMGNAAAVEFGRSIMPKADLKVAVYDQHRDSGGFVYALGLPSKGTRRELQ